MEASATITKEFSFSKRIELILERINAIVVGKPQPVNLALACLLARGHLLIEDVPGVGKTTLAQTLATVLGLGFSRIQFTSDLLPADVIGVSVYENESKGFKFHPGPIFSSVVLADEINRATPKAQSALLEAMEERQVSTEGRTYPLPHPFFVIATQNPRFQIGTFPLPESQLDRFLMRIELGYPDRAGERALLTGKDRRSMLQDLEPASNADLLIQLQRAASSLHCSEALVDYVQLLLAATRHADWLSCGLSPRAGIGVIQAARSWAMLAGRSMVLPEDVQAVAPAVLGHRLQARDADTAPNVQLVERLLGEVAIP
jgi:MoxR-like ATPase